MKQLSPKLRSFFFVCIFIFIATSSVKAEGEGSEIRLLAFGDSLIHGYGLERNATFPAQLEATLRQRGWNVVVINGGNSGDTTAAGLQRLDWSLQDKPDGVLVELGANDALRGLDPELARKNLDLILRRLEEEGLPTLLIGMHAPRNLGEDYARAFDAIFPELAETHSVSLYPFFLEGVALQPNLNQPDGIHPNKEGVGEIVERILPHVEDLLSKVAEKRLGKVTN
ncbi:MAG: arylesterase [Kiloniellales bacterium]|nr:arylesterase [Kiloniellales bacterium]